ncbi:MAG: MATE family efflux transporter [Coprobacillaceae bacterium]
MEKENKMGTMPINKLLVTMSLPMIIAMLVQALYNIVDSVFVAQINENALTAVSLAFPVQNLMIAFAGGTGVGINALLSRSLGEKNQGKVNKVANTAVILGIANSILFLILGLLFHHTFFALQTNDAQIINYGSQYVIVVAGCSFGIFMQFVFERLLQATGRTMHTMFSQGLGAIINIILDPILIFGYFGFPAMGVSGAAIATVIGQIIAAIFAFYLNIRHNKDIQLKLKGFVLDLQIVKQIYVVGIPSIIMQSIGSIMTFGMNQILTAFSTTATAVFGVYFKLQSFIFMPVFGLNNGMIPIIAYNYGAGEKKRLFDTIRLSSFYAVGMMLIGFLIFQLFPEQLLLMFNASNHMFEIGVPALRVISISFILAGFCIVCGSTFQALGKGTLSLITSVVRQLVVLLPVAFVLSKMGEVFYVWLAFPISELSALALCIFFLRKVLKQLHIEIEEPQEVETQKEVLVS